MPLDRRRLVLVGGLALTLGLSAWMLFAPAQKAAPAAAARPRPRPAKGGPAVPEAMVAVRVDSLKGERDEPVDTARNPFRFQVKLPPPPKTVDPPKPMNQTPPGPEPPRGPAPPPPIPLKFIGIVGRENGPKWAVLTDGKTEIHGREGEIVDGRYQILKIGAESIELVYADGRGRQTIRLSGQ